VEFTENIAKSPSIAMERIADFLSIDEAFFKSHEYDIENPSFKPKSKLVYRYALRINSAFEPLLNKVPVARRIIRVAHNSLNTSSEEHSLSPYMLEVLGDFYAADRSLLLEILQEDFAMEQYPGWLLK
jgi:hypothetical protein